MGRCDGSVVAPRWSPTWTASCAAPHILVDVTDESAAVETPEARTRGGGQREQCEERVHVTMSHELRTPLHAILGLGQLLTVEPLTGCSGLHRPNRGAGGHLLRLIDEVLDISQIEGRVLAPAHGAAVVAERGDRDLELVVPAARGAECRVNVTSDLAESSSSRTEPAHAGTPQRDLERDQVQQSRWRSVPVSGVAGRSHRCASTWLMMASESPLKSWVGCSNRSIGWAPSRHGYQELGWALRSPTTDRADGRLDRSGQYPRVGSCF